MCACCDHSSWFNTYIWVVPIWQCKDNTDVCHNENGLRAQYVDTSLSWVANSCEGLCNHLQKLKKRRISTVFLGHPIGIHPWKLGSTVHHTARTINSQRSSHGSFNEADLQNWCQGFEIWPVGPHGIYADSCNGKVRMRWTIQVEIFTT